MSKGKGVLQRIQWEGQDLTQGVSHVIFKFTLLFWGTWVAELVEHLTSTQVMISWFVGSSPCRALLTAQSLEPASDSVSPSLSVPSLLAHSLPLKNK